MNSILLVNNGNMDFSPMNLPSACQAGPVKALHVNDFNKDGRQDFMYAGNHLPTEVETARYDGLYPGICFGDGKGQFKCQTMFINNRLHLDDIRDIQKLKLADGSEVYVLSNNAGPIRIYSINEIADIVF